MWSGCFESVPLTGDFLAALMRPQAGLIYRQEMINLVRPIRKPNERTSSPNITFTNGQRMAGRTTELSVALRWPGPTTEDGDR